ncbi:MAG: YidC/Oxa1 family membrane protein insertase [Lachnospiraceae bacterium]|nr:YidC/Oxa1 family membrane protein insertase [Lachnospiraceae bacterium]
MMDAFLTTYQGALLGPIARLLGKILEGIYYVLSLIGIQNTGICLILFTFIVNGLMIPLQIKQQKFSKMSAIMNPELQEIQKKYKNKKDQQSQQMMSMETQAVYKRYGVSPASGCLPLLITFPILFALYRVIYNVPAYVGQVYDIYAGLAEHLRDAGATVKELSKYLTANTYVVTDAVKNAAGDHAKDINYYVDILGQYGSDAWDKLKDVSKYSALSDEILAVREKSKHINYFLGLNIANSPSLKSVSVIIPILSVVTQFISTKVSMAGTDQSAMNQDNAMGNSMKTMNNVMPFVTGAMCFMFPIGVGIYWVTGNVFRILQSIGINIYFNHIDMDEMVAKNVEKNRVRMEKLGVKTSPSPSVKNKSSVNGNNSSDSSKGEKKMSASEAAKSVKKSDHHTSYQGSKKYKEGSIAAYANMLRRDENNK